MSMSGTGSKLPTARTWADLNTPQRRDDGEEYYGYSLIREVQDGDIVFHYHKPARAIISWSLATGHIWEDVVHWGAHGTSARVAGVQPYSRPGWRLGLAGTSPLVPSVDLQVLRNRQEAIQAVRERLEAQHGRPVYFPFEPPEKRDLRPTQAYLTKLPVDLLALFPALTAAAKEAREARAAPSPSEKSPASAPIVLGSEYRDADEELAISERDPFTVDPALVERAHRGHAATQNLLANYLRSQGLKPRSPAPGNPNFDLAWVHNSVTYVAEIKSLTEGNEEKQLRLGLGQVLRYRHLLGITHSQVCAVLVAEREPTDRSWLELCCELKVLLVWPEIVQTIP